MPVFKLEAGAVAPQLRENDFVPFCTLSHEAYILNHIVIVILHKKVSDKA